MKLPVLMTGLAIGASAMAQKPQPIEFERYTLDNGLKVILHEDHSTPIVAVSIMYHVGSKNEELGRTGMAHFFEHLLFEGSENIGRGEYTKYVENAGGTLNANTSNDRTYYYEIMPSNQLELGLWLESERLLHAKVESIGIETQREVVKEEKRQRVDNQPYGSILAETVKRAYKVHPYQWPTIGSMADLNAAKDEDFMEFYETFYVPNNAILSISGDLDIEETKKLVEKYFGGIPKGTKAIPRPTVKEPALDGEVRDTVYDNIQLPAVIQAYRIPEQTADDAYAIEMLTQLLSGGQSSRFYKRLVDQEQKALAALAFPFTLEDPGLALMYGIAAAGVDAAEVEALMDEEVEKVKTGDISDREFQKLKNQIENRFYSSNSSMAGIAEQLAQYEMYYGDANLINNEIDRYMKVTKADIKRVANKYFNKDNRVVLYYLAKPQQ